jgi:hypothetical protein
MIWHGKEHVMPLYKIVGSKTVYLNRRVLREDVTDAIHSALPVVDCNRNGSGLQAAPFQDHLLGLYLPPQDRINATEPASMRPELQSIAAGQDELPLTRRLAGALPTGSRVSLSW